MLVRVQVAGLDPAGQQRLDLRPAFGTDEGNGKRCREQLRKRCRQTGSRSRQGLPLDKDQVTPDAKTGVPPRDCYGIVKSMAVRHQGRRADDAVQMAPEDALIHVPGKSEVVRIHDQALHASRNQAQDESGGTLAPPLGLTTGSQGEEKK